MDAESVTLWVTTTPNVTEGDVRKGNVSLLLTLGGDAQWNFTNVIVGVTVTADGGVMIPVSHAQQVHPKDLRLRLAPAPKFDLPSRSALTVSVSHLCGKSLLRWDAPCGGQPLLAMYILFFASATAMEVFFGTSALFALIVPS